MSHLRKRVNAAPAPALIVEEAWLDLARIAAIEITSEAPGHPIDAALEGSDRGGWRADTRGRQTLRILFDEPQRLERISIAIEEAAVARTQELSLAWVAEDGMRRPIVRQRWNFSPDGSTREVEDYRVDLANVRELALVIDPDVANPQATASLERLRLR